MVPDFLQGLRTGNRELRTENRDLIGRSIQTWTNTLAPVERQTLAEPVEAIVCRSTSLIVQVLFNRSIKRKKARTATHTERAPRCADVIRDAMVRLGYA